MDVSQYLEIFLDETSEHLQNLNTQILLLEQEPDNMMKPPSMKFSVRPTP